MNATIKSFRAEDGTNLYYQHWIPRDPTALIIFVHNMGGHIGLHGDFVKHFASKNYAVALYDQRGHGRSGGRRGDAKNLGEFIMDLSRFVHFSRNECPKGTPIFLFGEGVGAQFIINLIVPTWHATPLGGGHPGKIDGFITISPSIDLVIKTSRIKERFVERLGKILPTFKTRFEINPIDVDDPLVNRKFSIRLQKEILENTQMLVAMASRIQIPALIFHEKDDLLALPDGTKQFFLRLPSTAKRLKSLIGLESSKDEIFKEIEDWTASIINLNMKEKIRTSKENVCELMPTQF